MNQGTNPILSFLPLIVFSVMLAVPATLLAKEKGRDRWKWAVLSLIPGVNVVAMAYFVGTPSSRIEAKLDRLLARQSQDNGS